MRSLYISVALLASATIITSAPLGGHGLEEQDDNRPQIRSSNDLVGVEPLVKDHAPQLTKRDPIDPETRAEMLKDPEQHEMALWRELFDCVQNKISTDDRPQRMSEKDYLDLINTQCRRELGWTDEQYARLEQLRSARLARFRKKYEHLGQGSKPTRGGRRMQFSLPVDQDLSRFPSSVVDSAAKYLWTNPQPRQPASPNHPAAVRPRGM